MKLSPQFSEGNRDELLNLLSRYAYRQGEFTLSSGLKSKHYVNCKPVSLSGFGLFLISFALLEYVEQDSVAVAGLTLGADPLVSGVAMIASQVDRSIDALIVRKEAKGHGTGAWLEGPRPPKGKKITVLEDVVTTGGSSLKAVQRLRDEGYEVSRVVTIVDREEGGLLAMKAEEIELISLFSLNEIASRASQINQ